MMAYRRIIPSYIYTVCPIIQTVRNIYIMYIYIIILLPVQLSNLQKIVVQYNKSYNCSTSITIRSRSRILQRSQVSYSVFSQQLASQCCTIVYCNHEPIITNLTMYTTTSYHQLPIYLHRCATRLLVFAFPVGAHCSGCRYKETKESMLRLITTTIHLAPTFSWRLME